MTKDEIIEFLKEHKSRFANDFGIKRLALFGSYARDEANVDSDIDILVDMPSSFKKFYSLKYFLEDNFSLHDSAMFIPQIYLFKIIF